ncbi:hypothetical protein Acr_22g0007000 [Actinidia rufa]|uniref:Uncharacterized protein n=1 Tax=Actinidia rufa TaxID=165716 RepID=A0A7J0GKK5_9ERIC|nr:hypothetical protein Acr_22g0007000 [Actinidia rufa]
MEDYDFELHYHPGKANVVADALNRKSLNTLASISIGHPFVGTDVGETTLAKSDWVRDTTDKVVLIRKRLLTAQSRQKSYADRRKRHLEFAVEDHVFLRVSPKRGLMRFGHSGKLSPRRTEIKGRGEALKTPPAWRSDQGYDSRRSKLEIRMEIFRRDFRAIQLRKCIPIGFWRVLVEIPSILPRPMARRRQYPSSWRADEQSDGGSGELSGDDLARSHGLVLPRSREFGDKQPPKRSWATSSGVVLGRHACLNGEFYPISVAPYSKCRGGLRDFRFMSHNSNAFKSGDLNSLPSWVSDHLGEGSPYMTDEVNQSPSSPMEGSHEESSLVAIHPRLPDEGETITSTRPGKVAFYEAAFPAGLRFPLHNTIRYSISLSEFRNLFSLNSNPKPNQGWLYFKARNKNVLLGGYPSNVKGWKSKFFFVSGDEWEIPEEKSQKGAARVPRTWGIPDKHCNNPPRLFDDEMKVFEEIFRSVEESGRFSVPMLLDSKSFRRVFASPGSRASRTAGDHLPSGEAVSSSSDVELRRLLPHIPDLTLLRWTGGKVLDPILGNYLNVPSSNPSSILLGFEQPVELESDDWREAREGWGASSGTAPAKRGCDRREEGRREHTSSPSKKAKAVMARKEKGLTSALRANKASSSKQNFGCSISFLHAPEKGLGLSQRCSGPRAFFWAARLLPRVAAGVIPHRQGEGDKLTLDQTATKLFRIGQALVLGSSLAVRSREAGEQASLQEGRVASMETEVARLQKLAADFEQQLAESRAREQQSLDELAKVKGESRLVGRSPQETGALVNELREALNKTKESAVEEFKSRRNLWCG